MKALIAKSGYSTFRSFAIILLIICLAPGIFAQTSHFKTHTEWEWNGEFITGTMYNVIETKISFVTIEFQLLDKHFMPVQTVSITNNTGISPNGQWKFKIQAVNVMANSVRLSNKIIR
jgi:hypothetical protein